MLQQRTDIDCQSKGVPERIREGNREILVNAYMQLPPYRVWLYCHRLRMKYAFHGMLEDDDGDQFSRDSPENVMAEGN